MKTTNHVIYIDGKPYEVGMLTGGSDVGYPSQWDDMLDDFGEDDSLLHCERICSWCLDTVENYMPCRAIRGCHAARFWDYNGATLQYAFVGFRPVLNPLEPDALVSEKDGSVLQFGSLYMSGTALSNPKNPVWDGDVPRYVTSAELHIGDSDSNPNKQIRWIKWRNLLVADRNIISFISWDDLNRMGFTNKVEESKSKTKSITEDVSLESVRLIDANAYRKVLVEEKSCRPDNDDDVEYGIQMAIDALDDMPTTNWESVRPHGQWTKDHRCTNCGEYALKAPEDNCYYHTISCPHCGAKMV